MPPERDRPPDDGSSDEWQGSKNDEAGLGPASRRSVARALRAVRTQNTVVVVLEQLVVLPAAHTLCVYVPVPLLLIASV